VHEYFIVLRIIESFRLFIARANVALRTAAVASRILADYSQVRYLCSPLYTLVQNRFLQLIILFVEGPLHGRPLLLQFLSCHALHLLRP